MIDCVDGRHETDRVSLRAIEDRKIPWAVFVRDEIIPRLWRHLVVEATALREGMPHERRHTSRSPLPAR